MLQYSPKIVTDSLVMCLDASNNKSYPTDLPLKDQLNLWLDAADDTTFSYSSGTTVSQWRDKSGQNNHAIVMAGSPLRSVAINSRKAVSFTSTTAFKCLTGLFSSTATHIVVCRATTSSATYQRVYHGGANTDFYVFIGALADYVATFWGSGPNVWFDVASNPPYITILNTLRIISAVNNGTTATPYYDGTAMSTKATTNSAAYTGYELNTYSNGAPYQPLIGEVCEIIVFNKQLSATELKQVHTYLGQKWGISNTDRSIVDLSTNNYSGSFGGAAGSQTVANMPDYDSYNKGALTFNGSSDEVNFGDVIKFTATQDFTLEVWVNYVPNSTSYVPLLSKEDSPGFGYALKVDETYSYQPYLIITGTTSAYRYANRNINDGVWHHIVGVAKASSTTIDMYVDGVLINGIANIPAWAGTATTNALRLGKNYGSAFFKGKLSNSKIYQKALSAAEVLQNYEAQKSKFANTIVQQGLVLNLDAGNPYSYAGAGTTWYDVSGNNYNGTLTNGPTYTSDNNGAIIFDGTNDYVTTSFATTSGQAVSYCGWVYSTESTATYKNFVDSLAESPMIWWNTSGQIEFDASRYTTTTVYRNQWVYVSLSKPAGNSSASYYVNGVLVGTGTAYTTLVSTPTLFNRAAGQTWKGNGAVVQIYNIALSAAQVLQNYNALKGRFGL